MKYHKKALRGKTFLPKSLKESKIQNQKEKEKKPPVPASRGFCREGVKRGKKGKKQDMAFLFSLHSIFSDGKGRKKLDFAGIRRKLTYLLYFYFCFITSFSRGFFVFLSVHVM